MYILPMKESVLILRHLERQINLGIPLSRLHWIADMRRGAVHRGLALLGITGYIPQFSSPIHLRNMDSPTIHSSTHSSVRKEFLLHTTG